MPKFKWEGLDKEGRRAKGQVEAINLREARRALRGLGVRPKKISPPSILEFDIYDFLIKKGLVAPFGNKELSIFTRQLSIMVNAGVPIIQALEIIYRSEKHPILKKVLKNMAKDVEEGLSINEALSKQIGFSKLYINLIKAGETGGILDQILEKLSEFLEKQEKTKKQVKGALQYPMIIMIVGVLVVYGLMVFVVPQFVDMLTDTGQKVPFVTQMVMDISKFIGEEGFSVLGGLVVFGFLFKYYISTTLGKLTFDRFTMKLPLFGDLIIKGALASFSRTLATMLSAGVTLTESLEVCIDIIDNEVIKKDLLDVKNQVVKGKTLAEPLMKISYFPELIASMVKVGEQTGNLDNMFIRVSEVFEDEVDTVVTNLTKLIEPLIIVVLGGMVATILVAMYLPIFMSAGGSQ